MSRSWKTPTSSAALTARWLSTMASLRRATDRPSTIVTGESYMSIRDAPGIASIDPNHAMIPPHDATPKPDRIFGKDNQDFSFQPPARGEAVTQHANEKEAN